MAESVLVPLPLGRHRFELESQARSFAGALPTRLVICCADPEPGGTPPWQRSLGRAFVLRSPGASVRDLGLRDALHHAVLELGVESLLLVVHSRCAHLVPEPDPQEAVAERGLALMDRLYAIQARAQRQVAAARDAVRAGIRDLAADPALRKAARVGLVHMVDSGILVAYDPARDDFEALL